jgi:hypothetical protein
VNYSDRTRRTDRKIESHTSERMVAVLPRIRIPGAPAFSWIPASEADRLRIYIPSVGKEMKPRDGRPLTPYHDSGVATRRMASVRIASIPQPARD